MVVAVLQSLSGVLVSWCCRTELRDPVLNDDIVSRQGDPSVR